MYNYLNVCVMRMRGFMRNKCMWTILKRRFMQSEENEIAIIPEEVCQC